MFNYFVFRLHKKYKHADLSMYIFKSTSFIRYCYFFVAYNTKNFIKKFCVLVGYIIDYV
jgi:hypothetical protein